MSNNREYIASLCNQIKQQHKQPSVAMIRQLSNRPLALPEVIEVLKRWKEDPKQYADLALKTTHEEIKTEEHANEMDELRARVFVLEQQVAELTALLVPKKR